MSMDYKHISELSKEPEYKRLLVGVSAEFLKTDLSFWLSYKFI